jgi:hypothetical protein
MRVVSTRVLPEPAPARIRPARPAGSRPPAARGSGPSAAGSAGASIIRRILGWAPWRAGTHAAVQAGRTPTRFPAPPRRMRHRAHMLAPGPGDPAQVRPRPRLTRCPPCRQPGFPGQVLCAAPPFEGAGDRFPFRSLTMEIFDYDNILLLPRKCRVESRSECDASIEFGGRRFAAGGAGQHEDRARRAGGAVPGRSGHFYVMHRFDLDNVAYARRMREQGLLVSISSGVKPADFEVIDRLAAEGVGADYITIDIAHGHADSVRKMIEHIKAEAAQGLRDRRQRGHARGRDRPGELGRRRHQGRRRPGQGVHHQAEDRLRHRRLAAQRAEVVCARGHQAHHRRRRHPPPRRHRQERALRRQRW